MGRIKLKELRNFGPTRYRDTVNRYYYPTGQTNRLKIKAKRV